MIKEYEKFEEEGKVGVSCSSIYSFTTNTKQFFDIVNNRQIFSGNTYTALGTIIHYCASCYINGDITNLKRDVIDYIDNLRGEYDKQYILTKYQMMANALFDWCDRYADAQIKRSEERFTYNLSERVVLNGTCDLILNNNTLIDFKTTKQTSPRTIMPENYEYQLLSYVYLLKKNGIEIDYAKLVFVTTPEINRVSEKTGKMLKDYPSQVYELGLCITDEKLAKVEETMKLINDSICFYLDNPEYKYLITHNMEDK